MTGLWQSFKEFLNRGNMMDLAIGIVIGAAFTGVINSLVGDIITPLIGILLGGLDFVKNLSVTVGGAVVKYGAFIQAIINFLITALALFLIIQVYNHFKRKEEKKDEVKKQVEPSQEVMLLTQIRDLMERNSGNGARAQANQPRPTPQGGGSSS